MTGRQVIALVVAVSLAVSGCGLLDGDAARRAESESFAAMREDPKGALRKALVKAKALTSVSYRSESLAQGQTVRGEGVVSFGPPERGEETMEFPPMKNPDSPARVMTMRTVGGAFYSKLDEDERAAFKGKKWGRLGLDLGDTYTTSDRRPADLLTRMLASGDPSIPDEETVDGIRTMRFTRDVPLVDLGQPGLSGVPPPTGSVRLSLWLDAKYQLRRSDRQGAVVTFLDFDVPVDVQAPPASEVVDIPFGP